MIEAPSAETSSRPPLTSFSSVDYTMPSEDKDAGLNVEEPVPAGMKKKNVYWYCYFGKVLHLNVHRVWYLNNILCDFS